MILVGEMAALVGEYARDNPRNRYSNPKTQVPAPAAEPETVVVGAPLSPARHAHPTTP